MPWWCPLICSGIGCETRAYASLAIIAMRPIDVRKARNFVARGFVSMWLLLRCAIPAEVRRYQSGYRKAMWFAVPSYKHASASRSASVPSHVRTARSCH